MTTPKIIGFIGKAGSGKDTCYELLRDIGAERNMSVTRVSNAQLLKDMCHTVFNTALHTSRTMFFGSQREKNTVPNSLETGQWTGRKIMQQIGGAFREISPDIWAQAMIQEAKGSTADVVVITDIRYKNEAAAVRSAKGLIVRLTRKWDDIDNEGFQGHASETEMKNIKVDVILNNAVPLEKVREKLEELL